MTEDDDRVAYLGGEGGSDLDDLTRADLDDLRDLLADESLWAEPPAGLDDGIVAAIAAEAVTRPARPETPAAPPDPAGSPTVVPLAPRRRQGLRLALSAAAAVAALAVAGIVVSRSGDSADGSVALAATDVLPDASGSASLRRTDSGWRIELDATGLPRRDGGRFYEAWLRNADGVLVSIGTFNEGVDVVLWAGVPPSEFSTLTITEEEADGDPASSGVRVLVGPVELE